MGTVYRGPCHQRLNRCERVNADMRRVKALWEVGRLEKCRTVHLPFRLPDDIQPLHSTRVLWLSVFSHRQSFGLKDDPLDLWTTAIGPRRSESTYFRLNPLKDPTNLANAVWLLNVFVWMDIALFFYASLLYFRLQRDEYNVTTEIKIVQSWSEQNESFSISSLIINNIAAIEVMFHE